MSSIHTHLQKRISVCQRYIYLNKNMFKCLKAMKKITNQSGFISIRQLLLNEKLHLKCALKQNGIRKKKTYAFETTLHCAENLAVIHYANS